MNREDAYSRIDSIIAKYEIDEEYVTITSALDYDALRVARKALEQQSCGDAISRQAVLKAIDAKAWEYCDYLISKNRNDEQKPVSHFADNLRECVSEDLPSVNLMPCEGCDYKEWLKGEVEPKTGHWVEHPEIETSTPEYLMFYECSECGDKQCFCKSDIHKKRFCGNCGCRMVEPQERSDKCSKCEYYINPDYARCKECGAESEEV